MLILAFTVIITVCGTVAAATPQSNTTISDHSNITTVNSTLQNTIANTTKKSTSTGDPIITGTVTINEYDNGNYIPVKGAIITVNSTGSNSRVLGTTTTDKNGNYYIDFYSTDSQFLVTASYLGCDNITNTVPVTLNNTDGLDYGSSNFQLSPKIATLTGAGPWDVPSNGDFIYMAKDDSNDNYAGAINVEIDGVSYTAFCIDLYTDITLGDSLFVNGPLPGTMGELSNQIDWGKVNYVLNNYSPSTDDEAAAMQCAIWYFTSVQYGAYPGNDTNYPGRYQFMTYSEDGVTQDGGTTVQTLAWQMIDAAKSMQYPSNITLQPKNTRLPNGGSSILTAKVTDSNGNPLSGITVQFSTDKGSLSTITGITDSNGQVSTILSGVGDSSSATVIAQINGQYGTLLYDNPANPLQNLVAMNVLPYTLSDSAVVNFDVTANVQISQTSTTPVNVGDTAKYVLTAYNNGPSTATGIMIDDNVPSGLTNVTVTPSIGSYYDGVWTIPTLADLGSATLTISGNVVSSMAGTTTTNTATRTAQEEYDSSPAVSSADIYTNKAGLTITNTGTTPVNVGDTGTFTITATNNGPDPATNIQINDPLPTGYTAGTPTAGTYNQTTGIWTITSLANGGIATLTFTAPITATMAGTTTTNHATATWTEYPTTVTIPDSSIYVKQAYVAISQSGNYSGNNVTFIVTATNKGPDTATNINIKDLIPSGLTGVTVTPSVGSYNPTTGIWTINSLLNGSSATLNITGTATPISTIYNNATKISQTEYDPYAPETTKIGVYVPSVEMYVMQYPWYYDTVNGYENTYSYNTYPIFVVDVENWGNDDATGVIVNYTLGTGLQYIARTLAGMGTATYKSTTRTITWNIGNMPTTGTALMMVDTQAIATGDETPALTNTATLTNVDQYDTPNNYKTANYSINVPKNADIQVNLTKIPIIFIREVINM